MNPFLSTVKAVTLHLIAMQLNLSCASLLLATCSLLPSVKLTAVLAICVMEPKYQ